MKKSNLVTGIVYVLLGIGCLLTVILLDTELDGILCGFAGAGLALGCIIIYKYFYWTSPKHEKQYQEKIKQEQIELHDELKEKLRDKSGRYAYIFGLVVVAISSLVFAILDSLQIMEHGTIIAVYLLAYLVLQYVAGVVIFKHLLKKYE